MTPTALRFRPGTSRDRMLLDGLLRGLSPDSAYRRFQTGLGAQPSQALLAALLPDWPRGGSVLGFCGDTLVAHGVWVRVGCGPAAEVAIVVADAYQHQGVGTEIAEALITDLAACGHTEVEVFAAAANVAVARMVDRQAPDAERDRDGATITYRFPARTELPALAV
jgi:GNAT superfamily N-acetyltransferase